MWVRSLVQKEALEKTGSKEEKRGEEKRRERGGEGREQSRKEESLKEEEGKGEPEGRKSARQSPITLVQCAKSALVMSNSV